MKDLIQDMIREAGYNVEKSVSEFVCIHAYDIFKHLHIFSTKIIENLKDMFHS